MQMSKIEGINRSAIFQIALILAILIVALSIFFFLPDASLGTGDSCTPNKISSTSSSGLLSNFNVTCLEIKSENGSSPLDGVVYVANSVAQQEQGFMNVTSFGSCNGAATSAKPCIGMIFNFSSSQSLCFWMHDTEIPLEQVWLAANGTVTYVYQAQAENNTSVCYYGKYVLETLPQEPVNVGSTVVFGS